MTDRQTMLREALDAVVGTMSWRGDEGIVRDAEAWRTLVGRIVMATNGDNDGQVPMAQAEPGCTCEPEHVWPCAILPRCDEPGCGAEVCCGFPSPTGYRRTCGRHYRGYLPTGALR